MSLAFDTEKRSKETPSLRPAPAGHLPGGQGSLLDLQRDAGNQAVQQLLRSGLIQAKLAISNPDDPAEREADQIAHIVMRSHAGAPASSPCSCSGNGEMCEECQQTQSQPTISRRAAAPSTPAYAPKIVSDVLRSPGHPLDSAARAFFEPRFGRDFSRVRLHSNAVAERSAQDVNALAYTAGDNIVFGPGRFSPGTQEGRQLIAHELTHVIQQGGSTAAVQRQPGPPDQGHEGADTADQGDADEGLTTEQLEDQADEEVRLHLNARRNKDKTYAWSLARKDKAQIEEKGKLSAKLQQEIAVKIRFFEDGAQAAYIQTLSGVLSQFPDQAAEIFGPPANLRAGAGGAEKTPGLTCDAGKHQYLLENEGGRDKARCMDIMTDPEYKHNLFDKNIKDAIGYTVEATTWGNIEYGRLKVMQVEYQNGKSEYFMLDEVGNFYYGGQTLTIRDFVYLKRKNGLIYPVIGDRIYFSEILTPNILAFKSGLQYQVKSLQNLYSLLQLAGAFAGIIGSYELVDGFKASLEGFRSSRGLPGKTAEPGSESELPEGPQIPSEEKPTTQREMEEAKAQQTVTTAAKGGTPTKTAGWSFKPGVDARVKTYDQAIREAFLRTGVDPDEFVVTQVAKTKDGKTVPVEWSVLTGSNRGAQVNVDDPTIVPSIEGPQEPHVGYQTAGKRYRQAVRGHIFPEEGVLATRSRLGE